MTDQGVECWLGMECLEATACSIRRSSRSAASPAISLAQNSLSTEASSPASASSYAQGGVQVDAAADRTDCLPSRNPLGKAVMA